MSLRTPALPVFALAAWLLCVGLAQAAPALQPWSGEAAPRLVLEDMDGARRDLADHRGQVVLINFWATWCGPCRLEMPSIQRLRDRFAGRPFAVLTVNVDEPPSRIRRFLEETALDLPVLLDRDKSVTRRWGVRVMPTTLLVGPDGRVRYRALGDLDWNSEPVAGLINQLMPR